MRQVFINVYKFEELSREAKETAICAWRKCRKLISDESNFNDVSDEKVIDTLRLGAYEFTLAGLIFLDIQNPREPVDEIPCDADINCKCPTCIDALDDYDLLED